MEVVPKIDAQKNYSIDEYFEMEKGCEEKVEFWDGRVWSVSGDNYQHNVIASSLMVALDLSIRGKGFSVFPSHMRVKVPSRPPYRYPDMSCVLGDVEVEQIGGIDVLINPAIIVEIIADSTEALDRGDKFSYYKSIPSFSEYILVAQHRPHVSHFVKHADGFWANYEYNDLESFVDLRSVDCSIPMSEIYRAVTFPEPNLSLSETVQSTE